MADLIGRISVPTTVLSTGGAGLSGTQVFPLTTELSSYGFSVERPVIVHRFGSMDAKQEQRFYSGIGPRKFRFSRGNLGWTEARELRSFWESMQGPWEAFTYNVPNPGGTTTSVLVTFEETPVSFNYLRNACQTGFNLVEVVDPTAAPTYAVVAAPCLRFPSTALSAALLSEVQEIVPLIHIRVQEATVPDIWLSDRRVTLTDGAAGAVAAALGWAGSSQLYLPRITGIGEPGSDTLISQDIKGSSDSVRFTFGNADRTMTDLSNDTDLKYAEIDFCAFNVNSGILIQIWKGVIQNFTSDGTPNFPVVCSDGFFQIMNQYPERQASRQCWKTYNDGVYCLWATKGANSAAVTAAGGDPNSCDFYLESANGCQVHGMSPYFGGQQADPQGVIIKDDSTGFLGFGRNKVTATSIITEYIWGLALPEIWCNSGGNALYAFMANALMVAYRDESTYADSLGILGAGPLGGFTPSQIVANADGYRYVVAPMVDGYTWQGFQVNGNLVITKNQPGMGLRQVLGNDPANPTTDYFSLGQGTPQTWEPNNYAAGVAFCEVRITKSSTIQPSTPDQHQMVIPLDYGLSGFVWDQSGNRSVVSGLINPFWIAVNMLLRAMGLTAGLEAPLNTQTIVVTLPPSSFFSFSGSTIGDFEYVAALGNPVGMWACLIAWIGSAFTGNAYSVPMSNAANQAEVLLATNLYNWQSLAPRYQTAANRTIFAANFATVWNAYVQACVVIAGPNPTGNAEKALIASVEDRMAVGTTLTLGGITFTADGKYDWTSYYLTPITGSATPGDSMSYPSMSAQQLGAFVLSSLIVGDGSGAAEIAAAQVPAILGTGNEIQFQFQGSVGSQKPFRDWLSEVLNCCLGFYTWEFGKLKLGCRINASAVDAYTLGSILFQTLKLTPTVAAFEHLIISYADVAYQFQANTADYCDKSHAAYYGRAGSPLTSQMHSVGISTLSQALRIAATRTREECGGVTPMEWRNARNASWQTTLLGLGNEVGQVVSMTHPDIPGARGICNVAGAVATFVTGDAWTYAGTATGDTELVNKVVLIGNEQVTITAVASDGSTITTNPAPPSGTGLSYHVITMCFRIQKWSLKKDWSVQLEGQTVTASMYDLDVGPKPVDVAPAPPSPIFYAIPAGPVWAPYQIQANASDALFPGEWTFDSDQVYVPLSDGGQLANLVITGKLPVNEFSATGAGAPGIGLVAQSSTGGSLPAMVTLYVAICAIDAVGLPSVPSNIVVIGTSITGTDSFTLANITWPAVTGLASFVLFLASQDDLICEQLTGALTPTGDGTRYSPSSITFSGPLARSTWAMPSPYVAKVRVKAKLLVHSGVIGASVASVSTNTIVSNDMVDTSATPFNAAGRVLSMIGRPNGATPFASFNIVAHVPATGTLTLDRDPTGIVLVGDAFDIRFKADNLNSMPALVNTVNDNGCKNSLNAYGGMGVVAGVGVEIGNLIRIIAKTGRGQPPSTITANTATGLTFQPALTMDETSVWILEGPTWGFQTDSTTIDNASPLTPVALAVPTANFIKQPMLIAGFTVDVNGNESPDGDAPVREDWIYGAVGTNASPGATLQVAGTLAIGSNQSPPLQLNATRTPNEVVALVGTAPTGAGLTININVGGVLWMSLTIAAGTLSVQASTAQLTASGALAGGASITLDITAVGTTVPGADLSVFIYM